MDNILITGASGFVGTHLSAALLAQGKRVTGIGTSPCHPSLPVSDLFHWVSADTRFEGLWQEQVAKSDIIINLAGKNIFSFWTKKNKQAIYDSRILTTKNIVKAIEKGQGNQLLTTSAVGVYGDCNDDILTEDNLPGQGFLSQVCKDWEKEAMKACDKGTRVAIMRFGVVLGINGALLKMVPAFKMFLGGPLGSGNQWFPWIHMRDLQRGVQFLISRKDLVGSFNFTAPEPVRQKDFARSLGRVLNRPAVLPAPAFMVKTVMGELGSAFLESQRAVPHRLVQAGYSFLFTEVDSALDDIFGK